MSSIYTTNVGTGINIHPSHYHQLEVGQVIQGAPFSKMFSSSNYMGSPYHTEDVTEEFIRRLIVYTDAMVVGDIKTISSEYLFAVKAAMQSLQYTRRPINSERVQQLWEKVTKQDGHIAENFAKELQDYITR